MSLYDQGWRQGSVLDAELTATWLDLTDGETPASSEQSFDAWVVCAQNCDLDLADEDSGEVRIELRPLVEIQSSLDWGIRARHLRLFEDRGLMSNSPRLDVSPRLLNSLDRRGIELPEERATALKTWLGRRYDRPAVLPEHLALAGNVAERLRATKDESRNDVHDVLVQFMPGTPPYKIGIFAVVTDDANIQGVRKWIASAMLGVDSSLGVVAQIEVEPKSRTSLALLEQSYSADLSQITWTKNGPIGAT